MNKVFLIGNLTKDPELTTTGNGIQLCKFTLAVSRRFSRDGQRETDFLNIVVWRNQAENCAKYLKKGSKAAISGSIQTRSYDAADGTKRYVTEIAADEVQFLSTKNEGTYEDSDVFEGGSNNNSGGGSALKPTDDDLPF
ncbi:MAG: single-stranded DNA-binding protein [Clostridiaceae bacterium]|jgi:single-strand DNA-binding protein|nr:single-stranded DNA-binding protein [Clostridiaceae bacterium]